jgi:hypothetical protein
MVRIKNQTEPIENRSGLVRFSIPVFKSNGQIEQNQYIVYMLILFKAAHISQKQQLAQLLLKIKICLTLKL